MRRIYCQLAAICLGVFAANAAGQSPQPLPSVGQAAPAATAAAAPAVAPQTAAAGCSNCASSQSAAKRPGVVRRFFDRPYFTNHSFSPDGFPTPNGATNAFIEFKFVFSSARQFYGDADSTRGHLYYTTVPPPYRIPYPQNQ